MPDTGAPWNIPYVEPTDLVRQWPAADEAQALAIAAALSASGGIVQVQHLTQVTPFTTTSQVDITGYTLDITPTSATNKVLVVMNTQMNSTGGTRARILGRRVIGGTTTNLPEISNAPAAGFGYVENGNRNNIEFHETKLLIHLDSPATTSAVTYKGFTLIEGGATFRFNQGGSSTRGGVSSITLIEVRV